MIVVDFLLCLASGTFLFSFQQESESILTHLCPRYLFSKAEISWWRRSAFRNWRQQNCQGKSLRGHPRNVSWGTYYTPYLGMTVTVHPQFHVSLGLYDFLKKIFTTLLNDFHSDFSIWLSKSSNFSTRMEALIWGPTKTPFLVLESLTRENVSFK